MKYLLISLILVLLAGCSTPRVQNFNSGEKHAPYNGKYIIYIENEPLKWNDFQSKPDISSTKEAFANITLTVTERMNVWWGYKYLEVHGIMFPNDSWVKNEFKNENKLKYFRTYHKIAELFARKMFTFIEAKNIKPNEIDRYKADFDSYDSKFQEYINQFNLETKEGNDTVILNKWIDLINIEFLNYPSNGSNKSTKFF